MSNQQLRGKRKSTNMLLMFSLKMKLKVFHLRLKEEDEHLSVFLYFLCEIAAQMKLNSHRSPP